MSLEGVGFNTWASMRVSVRVATDGADRLSDWAWPNVFCSLVWPFVLDFMNVGGFSLGLVH